MLTNVLKRIISALIIISSVIQISGFNLACAAGDEYKNPYKLIYMSEYDGEDTYLPANFSYRDGFGSNTQGGHYVSWKNVNFDESPVSVELTYGTMHSGTVAEIRVDSVLGPVLATFTPEPTGNMFTEGVVEVNVQSEVKGVHDLYFVWKNSYLNIKCLKFKKYGKDNLGYSIFEGMSEDVIYDDINTNALSYEIKLLNKLGMLGFIEESKFDSKKTVTRAELAQSLCGFYTDEVDDVESYFYDLPEGHSKSKYVNYVYQKGIIDMTSDGHFRPDTVITVEQALNVIKRFYNLPNIDDEVIDQTEKNLEETILSGVTGKITAELTRQNLAVMLSNAIEATYITYKTGFDGEIELYFTEGILKETRNIDKTYGLVNAVPSTSLSNVESGISMGEVLIGDAIYNDPKNLAQKYLGYNCVVFYEEVGGELTVEAIYPRSNVSETIIDTTKDDELETISEQVIEYYTSNSNGKIKRINLANPVYFVYNGKAIDETIDKFVDADAFQGKIRVINNRDCTAVLIDEYQNAVLKSIDSTKDKYLDRISDTVIDLSDSNTTVYKNSRPIMNSDIPMDSVAYIYRSKNTIGTKITRIVILPDNKITGIVKSIKDDTITIDSEEYKIAKENKKTYTVGLFGTFILNTYNEIVWSDTGATDELLLGIYLGYTLSEDEESVLVKLYTNDAQIEKYECSENFILDGVSRKKVHQIDLGRDTYKGLVDVETETPVMYMLNEEKKLTILDTYFEGKKTRYDTLVKVNPKRAQAGQKYFFSARSRILVTRESSDGFGSIPFETNFTLISQWKGIDEAYNIIEPYTNQFTSNDQIEANAYSTKGNDRIADILVCPAIVKGTSSKPTDFILVEEVIETLDKDDVPTRAITGYSGTEKVTKVLSHQLSGEDLTKVNKILDNLKRGDYIYVNCDPANNIKEIEVNYFRDGEKQRDAGVDSKLYKTTTEASYRYNKAGSRSLDGVVVYGKVTDIEDKFMFVTVGEGASAVEEVYALSSPVIYRVHPKRIENGLSIKEVFNSSRHGAEAVILLTEGQAAQIIIYE